MNKAIPTGRAQRLLKTAQASAVVGASAVIGSRSEAGVHYAAEMLGELRGLPAKAGQMAGYVDGFVPEVQRDVFRRAMGRLQTNATHSSPSAIQRLVEVELGAPLSELFSEWSTQAFASASIGQVHRARLPDGTRVAVKVQHPGIAEAIENDLKNAGTLNGLIGRFAPHGANAQSLFETAAARFREELDYVHEAGNLKAFAELHAEDPAVAVPRVYLTHCSRRVLTCAYCHGETLAQASGHPEPFRAHYAETLWRFVTRSILRGGMFNADPHPGNYLFSKDGKVVFLDFGCVQRLSEESRELARRMHTAALQRDEAVFANSVATWFGARSGAYQQGAVRFMRICFEPLFDSPFHMTPRFAARVVKAISEFKALMFTRDGSFTGFPPELVLLNRLHFGFYSVLADLDVSADYAAQEEDVLAEV